MSFRPSKAVEGGSAAFDGVIVTANTGAFTYQDGKSTVGILLRIFNEDDGTPRKYPNNYSAGRPSFIQANAKETGFEFADESKRSEVPELNKKSRAYDFMAAVLASGFPENEMGVNGDENDLSFLVGQRFHFELKNLTTKGGSTSDVLLPVKYLGKSKGPLPSLDAVETPATAGAGPAASEAVAAAKADLTELAQGLVLAVVAEAGGKMPRAKLNPAVLAKVDASQKGGVAQLLVKEGFLKSIPGVNFDGTSLVVA